MLSMKKVFMFVALYLGVALCAQIAHAADSPNKPDPKKEEADALLACDFFETVPLSGVRLYVLVTWNQAGELRGLDHQSSGD